MEMNIKRLLAVAVAAVFIGGMPCEAKTENTIRKDRKTLEKENAQLKAKMDSLKMDRYGVIHCTTGSIMKRQIMHGG